MFEVSALVPEPLLRRQAFGRLFHCPLIGRLDQLVTGVLAVGLEGDPAVVRLSGGEVGKERRVHRKDLVRLAVVVEEPNTVVRLFVILGGRQVLLDPLVGGIARPLDEPVVERRDQTQVSPGTTIFLARATITHPQSGILYLHF